MRSQNRGLQFSSFRLRKVVQYSLIVCILLIQITIGAFFYNEFINTKNLKFIEKQLAEIHSLEDLTDRSRKELFTAEDYLRQYLLTEDKVFLNSYFNSVNRLGENLDHINHLREKIPRLRNVFIVKKKDTFNINKLRSFIDSTYQYSTTVSLSKGNEVVPIKKFDYSFNLDRFDVETKTYSDTLAKKGLFGRLGDAIAGKVNVKKDSVVVTLKQGKSPVFSQIETELDSVVNLVNKYYVQEVNKIQVKKNKKEAGKADYFKIFDELLVYSNDLMNIYEVAIKDSKGDLEKEYAAQNSYNNKIRKYLVLGLMGLMFIVSILIMYFTRMAFIYEKRLNAANLQIKENLNFKNRILGMLSHELRSPLKIISIFIGRITKKTTDSTIKEYLKSISFTNDTLLMQANQILEYTKNQHVENKLNPVKFNLSNEIHSIIDAIEPYIETRNNTFITEIDIDDHLMVFTDNTKINQLFMNILGNANKFTENGSISVKSFVEDLDFEHVKFSTVITDTGAGISKLDLEKIFEPYYQGILSEKVENLGAGLGLSLCKELVDLYGGAISVTSELNQGTTVQFSLNLKKDDSEKS